MLWFKYVRFVQAKVQGQHSSNDNQRHLVDVTRLKSFRFQGWRFLFKEKRYVCVKSAVQVTSHWCTCLSLAGSALRFQFSVMHNTHFKGYL